MCLMPCITLPGARVMDCVECWLLSQVLLKARATSQSFLGNLVVLQSDKGSAPDYFMFSLLHNGAFVSLCERRLLHTKQCVYTSAA
jgi:hypothetical protein